MSVAGCGAGSLFASQLLFSDQTQDPELRAVLGALVGRTGTPLGSEGMCTHAPPDICEFKDCEFKDSVGFFVCFLQLRL